MNQFDIKRMTEERGSVINQLEAVKAAGLESAENAAKFDELFAQVESLTSKIEAGERSAKLDKYVSGEKDNLYRPVINNAHARGEQVTEKDVDNAYKAWLMTGNGSLIIPENYLRSARKAGINVSSNEFFRATDPQASGTTTTGGYTANSLERIPGFVEMLKDYGSMRGVATIWPTSTNKDLPFPVMDNTSQVGQVRAENAQSVVQTALFEQVVLKAKKYDSDAIVLSSELISDSEIDILGYVNRLVAERISRKIESDYAIGANNGSQSAGITVTAPIGKQTAGPAAVEYEELVDLQASVNEAYQNKASWMMHSSTFYALAKIMTDAAGPMWSNTLMLNGAPRQLLGKPVHINDSFPAIAANAVIATYGDHSAYFIRDVGGLRTTKLGPSLGYIYDQVGVVGYWTTYGKLVRSTTDANSPVKSLETDNS